MKRESKILLWCSVYLLIFFYFALQLSKKKEPTFREELKSEQSTVTSIKNDKTVGVYNTLLTKKRETDSILDAMGVKKSLKDSMNMYFDRAMTNFTRSVEAEEAFKKTSDVRYEQLKAMHTDSMIQYAKKAKQLSKQIIE